MNKHAAEAEKRVISYETDVYSVYTKGSYQKTPKPNYGPLARDVAGDNRGAALRGVSKPKPYSKNRPSYRKGQREQVWENAKDSITGKVYDPTGKEITWDKSKPRNGQWDMGHIPGEKYSEIHKQYMDGTITKKEFLEWYKNPDNYRLELPSTNRSHKYE